MVYIDSKFYYSDTKYVARYSWYKQIVTGFMLSKTPIDVKIWEINGFPIHLEFYDSEIIVKDESSNNIKISKKKQLSIVLNVNGSFISG